MEGSTFVPGLLEVVASNWFGLEIPCLLSAAAGKKRGQGNRDWGGGGTLLRDGETAERGKKPGL